MWIGDFFGAHVSQACRAAQTSLTQGPTWPQLLEWLDRLHGWDVSESAVRIGAFSLYIALLEQVHPPVVRALKAEGKMLPRLLGKTLVRRDFFDEQGHELSFDVIVGNPPWVSRQPEKTKTALEWCQQHDLPMPGGELAWAFVWKAVRHLKPDGRACLLLPAMGILLNHSKEVAAARSRWLNSITLLRVINFADVCFQLFDGADRPTVMALFSARGHNGADRIDYWVPKAHRLLSSTKILIVPTNDRLAVTQELAQFDAGIWKKRMWATNRDQKLIEWLSDLPPLGSIVTLYSGVRRGLDYRINGSSARGLNPPSRLPIKTAARGLHNCRGSDQRPFFKRVGVPAMGHSQNQYTSLANVKSAPVRIRTPRLRWTPHPRSTGGRAPGRACPRGVR